MRTYETAAVKMAVKRSIRTRTVETGYQEIYRMSEFHTIFGTESVLKCFRKWIKWKYCNN